MKNLVICVFNIWFKLSEKLRFLMVGGFNTVVSFLIFAIFTIWLGKLNYQICLFLSWLVSSIISFSTQKVFVWRTKGFWIKEYCKCCISWGVSYLINASILEIFVKILQFNIYIGQMIAIIITAIATYILFKNFAFKRR